MIAVFSLQINSHSNVQTHTAPSLWEQRLLSQNLCRYQKFLGNVLEEHKLGKGRTGNNSLPAETHQKPKADPVFVRLNQKVYYIIIMYVFRLTEAFSNISYKIYGYTYSMGKLELRSVTFGTSSRPTVTVTVR